MKPVTRFLQSKDAVFYGAVALMLLYVPHAGHLFQEMEHLDLTVFGYSAFNWIYGIALAMAIEFLILVFIINGYKSTGKFYAVVSFFLNVFYYNYWFDAFQNPTAENIRATILSLFICLAHSLSVWQLSELFYVRIKQEQERPPEFWCVHCGAGPFLNKRSLDGHCAKMHRTRQQGIESAGA